MASDSADAGAQIGSYLPSALRDGLAPGYESVTGTFLSADISGFTRLSERLAHLGPLGAEVLSDTVDSCFTALIDCMLPLGGDVLFFGGDAMFTSFTGHGHSQRAVDAAVAMQQALRSASRIETPAGAVRLTMTLGAASGTAQLVVGDGPQRPIFLVGPTVTRALALESRATPGQILVAPATAHQLHLGPSGHLAGARLVPVPPRPRPGSAGQPDDADRGGHESAAGRGGVRPVDLPANVRMHLPAALRRRLLEGDAPREHRRIAVAFVSISGLDRMAHPARADRLRRLSSVIGEACDNLGVCWVSTDVMAGGAKAILVAGLPQQSNEDELRLVAAARRIIDGRPAGHLRIGMHRGTAFVGGVGHPLRHTYTVMGDTVNTAARLMGTARPGEALASAALVAQLHGRFDCGPERVFTLKGKAAVVRASPVGPPASRGSETGGAALGHHLVGREREMAVLRESMGEFERGQGEVLEVVGAPGMGKSRLLEWLRSELESTDPAPRMVAVAGDLALSDVPFAVLAIPSRQALGLGTARSPRTGLERLAGDLAPLVGPVVGIDLAATPATAAIEPRSVAERRAEVVADLFATALPGTAVLLVEDAHWLDSASAELLGSLARRLADQGWLVVVSRRPGTDRLCADSRQVDLEPLDESALRRLAIQLSGDRALNDASLDAVVARAGGNALFLQQLVQAALGGETIGLPESAARAVGARIDVLPARARHRLRQASVLGSEVDLELLATITGDDGLRTAAAWEGLEEFIDAGPKTLRFGHDLFRMAAYEGLPFAERSRLHERAGLQLEQRPGTPPAVLARHFGNSRRANRSADWAELAAREAVDKAAFADAARLWRHAADSARTAGRPAESQARLLVELGRAQEVLADADAAEAAYKAAVRLSPPEDRASVRTRLAWVAFRSDRLPLAKRRVTMALREAAAVRSEADSAAAHTELLILRAAMCNVEGDLAGSNRDARRAERDGAAIGRAELRAEALLQLALNADQAGDPDAPALAAQAFTLLGATRKRYEVGVLHANLAITHMVQGRWPAALEGFDAAAEAFERCGNVMGAFFNDMNRAALLAEQGHLDEASALMGHIRRRAKVARIDRMTSFVEATRIRAECWVDASDPPLREMENHIAQLAGAGHRTEVDTLRSYRLEVLLLAGRFDDAVDEAGPLLDSLLSDADGEVVVLTVQRIGALARLLADPGRITAAAEGERPLAEIHEVLDLAREQGATIEVARCLQALEALSPEVDPAWAPERERICRELGVIWMPPITFAAVAGLGPQLTEPLTIDPA